ncbi:MAG: DUF3592 domain-containing protein [Chlamydiales bacterium]|nr:DUF3592 domain-containing protein [Chlamydiales bacterium]
MNKKRWLILLVLAAGATLWFGGLALSQLYGYLRLREHAPAKVVEWKVAGSSSKFFITAHYVFEAKGQRYEGSCMLKEPSFLNPIAAEAELKEWAECSWSIWYDPAAPQHASLQKLFPNKQIFNGLVSLGVLGYFLLLPRLYRQLFSKAAPKKI